MTLDAALAALTEDRPLPGDKAHAGMMPEYRRARTPSPVLDTDSWKDAAVLILLYPQADQVLFPLMLRPSGQGVHSGQVCLPGGSREDGETHEDCALRETTEELGVDSAEIRVIRCLSMLRIPPSGFQVRPYVGVLKSRPAFRPSPAEVAALLETSLDELLEPGNRRADTAVFEGKAWKVPFFRLAGQRVWGATAMILEELSALLRGFQD